MEEDKLRLKKGDCFIFLIIVIMIVVLLFLISNSGQGNYVHITVNGITKTYALFSEKTISVANGKQLADSDATEVVNIIVIENGQVYMKNANCPDQVCVNHKPISKQGEMIICLPNEVFIEVENDRANEIDN